MQLARFTIDAAVVWRHAENDETNSGTMNAEKGHQKDTTYCLY